MINKNEYSWLVLLCARVNDNQKLNHCGPKPKTYRQAPNHWLKFYEEVIIESEAQTAAVQLKSKA